MSLPDWTGPFVAFGALMALPVLIWWRFGDPDRDDRITARSDSSGVLVALLSALQIEHAVRRQEWIWLGFWIIAFGISVAIWMRKRASAGLSRS